MPHLQGALFLNACSRATRPHTPNGNSPRPQWPERLRESFQHCGMTRFPSMRQHSAPFFLRDCLSGASSSRVLDDSGQVKRRTCGLLQHAGCHPAAFSDITVAIATMIATKFDTFLSALCLGHVMPHASGGGTLVRFRTRLVRSMRWTSSFYSID